MARVSRRSILFIVQAANFKDIIQLAKPIQYAAQLRHTGDFDGEIHLRGVVVFVRLGVHGRHVYFFITQDREVTRWEGWLLVLFYCLFLGQIMRFV